MKTKPLILILAAAIAAIAIAASGNPSDTELRNVGRIAAFAVHAKMIKMGETEKAINSLEGLMKHGLQELKTTGAQPGTIEAARRAIADYYEGTGQKLPEYLNEK